MYGYHVNGVSEEVNYTVEKEYMISWELDGSFPWVKCSKANSIMPHYTQNVHLSTLVLNEKRKKSPVIQFADLAHVYGWSMSSAQLPGRTDDSEKALSSLSSHISVLLCVFHIHSVEFSCVQNNQTWSSAVLQVQSVFDIVLKGLQCDSHQLRNI